MDWQPHVFHTYYACCKAHGVLYYVYNKVIAATL